MEKLIEKYKGLCKYILEYKNLPTYVLDNGDSLFDWLNRNEKYLNFNEKTIFFTYNSLLNESLFNNI